jgi:hypothetical protein
MIWKTNLWNCGNVVREYSRSFLIFSLLLARLKYIILCLQPPKTIFKARIVRISLGWYINDNFNILSVFALFKNNFKLFRQLGPTLYLSPGLVREFQPLSLWCSVNWTHLHSVMVSKALMSPCWFVFCYLFPPACFWYPFLTCHSFQWEWA